MAAKRKHEEESVPEWAVFFDSKQYKKFMSTVDGYFKLQEIAYSTSDGTLTTDDDRFGADQLGLVNLAQECNQYDEDDWKEVIEGHFTGLQRAHQFQEEFEKRSHDFEYAREYLAVRLYHMSYLDQGDDFVAIDKDLTEDIFAVIVFDFPESIANVRPEQTVQWNKTNEELFEVGLANVRKKYAFEISEQVINDIKLVAVTADHFYAGNIVFDLEDYAQLIGTHGSLVSVPTRHTVIIYPIENAELVRSLDTLIPLTYGVHEDGPGSISKELYWYTNGDFINLPYEFKDDQVSFQPPDSFFDLMNSLEE